MDKDGWQFVFPGLVKLISFQVNLHVHTENSVEQMHSGTYFSWSLYGVHLKTIWQDNHMFFGAEPWERWLCFSFSILSDYKRTGLDCSFHCTLHQAHQGVMNCWSTDQEFLQHYIFLLLVCLAVFTVSCLQSNIAGIFSWFSEVWVQILVTY